MGKFYWGPDQEIVDEARAKDGTRFVARVILDHDAPSEPEFDAGCPVWRVSRRSYYRSAVEATNYGFGYATAHVDRIEEAIEHFREKSLGSWCDDFERWLSIYHDGQVVFHPTPEAIYVAVATQTLWEAWGNKGIMPLDTVEMNEYEQWLEGYVFGYRVEQLNLCDCPEHADGFLAELDSCWGYYGEHVEDDARASLKAEVAYYNKNLEELWAS